MAEVCPKILVCTVGSWSSKNGSDTMASLLKDYDAANLACLYIRADKSDSPICSKYYHIYEQRVVRSIWQRGLKTGESFSVTEKGASSTVGDGEYLNEVKRYKLYKKIRSWWLILVRELLWKLGCWNTKDLNDFLTSFNPDVVLFPIEGYIHFNRITEYIIHKCNPNRVIGYMWDDNFTYKQHPYSIAYRIHRWWLRKGVGRLISACDTVFAICPKMKRELDATYNIDSVVLTKPLRTQGAFIQMEPQEPVKMIYTGKLNIGRDKTIGVIAEAMKEVNSNGQRVTLDIYTDTPLRDSIHSKLSASAGCELHGFVPQEQVIEKQQKADVLLFVEALSSHDMSARLSFSTKITDYLSAGKCIWAVGNSDLAPVEYLREKDVAMVSTTRDEVLEQLLVITGKRSLISLYARKAFECGMDNHNAEMIKNKFNSAIIGTKWGG